MLLISQTLVFIINSIVYFKLCEKSKSFFVTYSSISGFHNFDSLFGGFLSLTAELENLQVGRQQNPRRAFYQRLQSGIGAFGFFLLYLHESH